MTCSFETSIFNRFKISPISTNDKRGISCKTSKGAKFNCVIKVFPNLSAITYFCEFEKPNSAKKMLLIASSLLRSHPFSRILIILASTLV